MSSRPSALRAAPSRPPVVWVLPVYRMFSMCVMVRLAQVVGSVVARCASRPPRYNSI